jgi:Uma2 family endonuclease
MNTIILDLSPFVKLTDEQYYRLAIAHPNLRMERTPKGELVIMPPTGGNTGRRNIKISKQLETWSEQDGTGVAFDSSTEFKLPGGGDRSPDAAWIKLDRWNTLTEAQQEQFPPLCPDFVVELKSPSDSMPKLREKMQEYLECGIRLGWLIDPKNKVVEIYRPNREKEVLQSPESLSGEDVLPGFVLALNPIFNI